MKHPIGTRFHYDRSLFTEPLLLERLELLQIGELCLEPGFAVCAHNQSCSEISYVISGSGTFFLDGQALPVRGGDIIITPDHGEHRILAAENGALFFAYCGFRLRPDCFAPELLDSYRGGQLLCQDRRDIYLCFRRCMEEFTQPCLGDRLVIEACMTQIIVWSARSRLVTPSAALCPEPEVYPGLPVYRAMQYVEQNLHRPLTVTDIAGALGYSTCYLSHLFRQKTDTTLQGYIQACKIRKARELMALNRFTLTQIAEKLGFPSPQAFSRTFRAQTGRSPSEYLRSEK